MERKDLDWNPQGARKRGKPCGNLKRNVEKQAASVGRTLGQLRDLARDQNGWRGLPDWD